MKVLAVFFIFLYSLTAYCAEFSIVDDYKKLNIKRSVKVVLNEKITTEKLTELATNIKNLDPIQYERTFIGYYLKGQENLGFWATSNFNPNLEIQILGVSLENEKKTKELKFDNALGAWLDEDMNVIDILYYKNKKLFLGYKGTNPEKDVGKISLNIPDEEMITKKVKQGLRVDDKNGNDFGDFYIINKNGDLEIWNKNKGKLRTLKKLN